jgi:hypothetical protein
MKHEHAAKHAAWTGRRGHTWKTSMELHGRAAWTHSTDLHMECITYIQKDMQHGHAAWTRIRDIQHGNSAWTCSKDMQNEHTAWTYSLNIQYGYAAWKFGIYMKRGHDKPLCFLSK